jgi:hypothetical protein
MTSDTEGDNEVQVVEPAKEPVSGSNTALDGLKSQKRNLKTKATRARFRITRLVSKENMVSDINSTLDIINLLNDDLVEVLEKLQETDAEKYEKEMDEIQETCGDIIKTATEYVVAQSGHCDKKSKSHSKTKSKKSKVRFRIG